MEDLRVAGVRAIADLGGSILEVTGTVVVRRARRLSDFANHPDPMLDLDDAQMRVLHVDRTDYWEEVGGVSLNRDRIVLIIPVEDQHPGGHGDLQVAGNRVRVKVISRGLQVTGFVRIPVSATVSSYIQDTRVRFLAVSEARVIALAGDIPLETFGGIHPFCLVNREFIIACIEGKREIVPGVIST